MTEPKTTKLQIREDRPTAISGSAIGSNLDAIGFNIAFIAAKNPKLAVEIMRLYTEAHSIQESDPKALDEDFELFTEALQALLGDTSE
jgi:hypothetical protein